MRLRNIPGAKDAIEESIYVIQNPQENKGCWDKVFPGRRRSGNHHHFHRKTGESAGLLRNPGNSKYAPGLASDQ